MSKAVVAVGVEFDGYIDWYVETVAATKGWKQISRLVLERYRHGECCQRPSRITIDAPHLTPSVRTWKLAGDRYRPAEWSPTKSA